MVIRHDPLPQIVCVSYKPSYGILSTLQMACMEAMAGSLMSFVHVQTATSRTEQGSANNRMSSSAAASSYWRVAGMTYLKYSSLCAGAWGSPLQVISSDVLRDPSAVVKAGPHTPACQPPRNVAHSRRVAADASCCQSMVWGVFTLVLIRTAL